MDEAIKDLVATAKKIQDAAGAAKMQVEARACIIAASNLVLADAMSAATKPKK